MSVFLMYILVSSPEKDQGFHEYQWGKLKQPIYILKKEKSPLSNQLSRIPDPFHRSQSNPTPTGALGSPLISRTSNNSYSRPNARK